MAVFGLYYTKNMLRLMDWPRKQGLLKKEYIDRTVFNMTVNQMVDWAAAIGAGKPNLALQIIAYIFRSKDWDGADAPDIKMFVEGMNDSFRQRGIDFKNTAPHAVVGPLQLGEKVGATFSPEVLKDKQVQTAIEEDFLGGLLYGLSHHREYEEWFQHSLEGHQKNMDLYKKADIGVDKLPTLSETYRDSEEIIQNYKQEMEIQLPPIPPKLLADAKALR